MSTLQHASGYGNELDIGLPPTAAVKLLYDYRCYSRLSEGALMNFQLDAGTTLSNYSRAYFTRVGEVNEADANEGLNGVETLLEARMDTDFAEVCQDLNSVMKFNYAQACRMGKRWDDYSKAMEWGVTGWMDRRTSVFGYIKLAASASPQNILGSVAAPLIVPMDRDPVGAETTMSTVIRQLHRKFIHSGAMCQPGDVKVFSPIEGYSALTREFKFLNVCCSADNPLVSGKVSLVDGFNLIPDIWAPIAGYNANGPIYYVIMERPDEVYFPIDICRVKWEERGNDYYLYTTGFFGFKVANPKAVAVAVVQFV